jgi:hypothetical protein
MKKSASPPKKVPPQSRTLPSYPLRGAGEGRGPRGAAPGRTAVDLYETAFDLVETASEVDERAFDLVETASEVDERPFDLVETASEVYERAFESTHTSCPST